MLLKSLIAVLALLLAAESLFIAVHHRPANRFKPVEGYDGVVAFDTATGQLCKTLRTEPAVTSQRPTGSWIPSLVQPSGDPVIDEMQAGGDKRQAEEHRKLRNICEH